MSPSYAQISLVALVLATLATFAYSLPPFEIRSAGNTKSEGSEEWIKHLQKTKACNLFTENHPTFLCSSTKFSGEPECIHDSQLCNGISDCPRGEDESPVLCVALRMVLHNKEVNGVWNS